MNMSTRITTKKTFIKNKSIHGFTIMELMVSLAVFSIVMTISMGTILTMINANAKAQALYSSTTNLSFALDSMTREMRMGYHYYCPDERLDSLPGSVLAVDDCTKQESIAFIRERDGKRVGYRLGGEAPSGYIELNDGGGWVRITSDDVLIDTFEITVINSKPYDPDGDGDGDVQVGYKDHPVVDLIIKGHVNNRLETDTDFNIQTHIIQRRLDIF